MSELKSCPFCGGTAHTIKTNTNEFVVGCFGSCYVELPLIYATREEAIKAWNRRVPDGAKRKVD